LGGFGRGYGFDDLRMYVSAEPLLRDIREVGLFLQRRCAVNHRAEMYCWGVGDTTDGEWPTPVRQPLPPGFARFARAQGGAQICYHATDGSVRCRGVNFQGSDGRCSMRPGPDYLPVPEIRGARSVALGLPGGCAVLPNATVACWAGDLNDFRALSNGSCLRRPTVIAGLEGASDVGMGALHVCALLLDGTVRCFGTNGFGQLGRGFVDGDAHSVAPVIGLPPVTQLAVGSGHNCALTRDHRVFCWGSTYVSYAGSDPSIGYQSTPTEVVFTD
jgi:hypothetical protein